MDFFSYVTGLIGQAGRRGALLLSIDCTHPDLEEFINLKTDLNICTKANISVRVSNDFMKAVENDTDWKLSYTSEHETIEKVVKAKDIFKLLAKRNWEMAEPGILFWDRICNYNMLNTDSRFKYAGLNPCAEEPLPAGGSCLLGSINLSEFVKKPFTNDCYIDFDDLKKTIAITVQGLNQVLLEGMDLHPLEVQRKSVYNWRQIGLGTLGLGDMLIKMCITYGSQRSIDTINYIFKLIATTAVETSLQLAKLKGCYPMCNKEALVESEFIKALNLPEVVLDDIRKFGLFNSQLLTCAPTGSIGTMIQASTGVEPNFAFSFTRKTISLNKEETYYTVDADIVRQYKEVTGNVKLPDYFISSQQIKPIDRLKVQAALQTWIDASISSTINLPENTTIDEVYNIYFQSWKLGLKGVTIWRDNCQREGILTLKDTVSDKKQGKVDNTIGLNRLLVTGCGNLHCQAFFDRDTKELREVYLSKGSTGGCQNYMIGVSRLASLSARNGVTIEKIIDQLRSCGVCPSYSLRSATRKDTSKGSSCPVAVSYALEDMYNEIKYILSNIKDSNSTLKVEVESNLEECPNCHEKTLIHEGGCISCTSCGFSKCS